MLRILRHRRLRLVLLGSAVASVALVAIGLTPGIRHTHSGGDVPHHHAGRGHSHPHSHAHHPSGGPHWHSHSHVHGRHHHEHHSHGHGHAHHHRHVHGSRSVESHTASHTVETRPHTHFSLWGFRFTIFDRAPSRDERPAQSATRPAKNRNALQASPSYARKFRESKARRTESQGRPPQSILTRSSHLSQLTAAEQESQVVEFRNGWTGSSVEFSGLPLVTPVEAVALPGGFREALLQNLEDDRAETPRERPALPPPERDRGSIPLDFIRRLAPRA